MTLWIVGFGLFYIAMCAMLWAQLRAASNYDDIYGMDDVE